jgi:hypothetical protein
MKVDVSSKASAALVACCIAVVSCRQSSPLLSRRHQKVTSSGWISSLTKQNGERINTPFWFLSIRGGSVSSPVSEPEVSLVDGTIESLYLPGLLDTSIHRPSTVSFDGRTSAVKLIMKAYLIYCMELVA